jgi:hypothetical protein
MPTLADLADAFNNAAAGGVRLSDLARLPDESPWQHYNRLVTNNPAAQAGLAFAPMGLGVKPIGSPRPDMEQMVEDYLRTGGKDLGQLASTIAARGDMLPTEIKVMIQNVLQRMQQGGGGG